MDLFFKLLFLCPALFAAGLIDGIAGGGGIISLPAFIMTGIPLNCAYGCNKLQSCLGTSASLCKYAKSGLVDFKTSFVTSITAISGSYISTRIILSLSKSAKSILISVFMCVLVALTILTTRLKSGENTKITLTKKNTIMCLVAGMLIGLYDGFFGPGGGSFALMIFVLIFSYDIRTATGNGKVIIVISNIIALANYIATGNIVYELAIPATIANIFGSYLGASLAVKNGRKLVKPILLVVVTVLVVQGILKLV